MEHTGSSFIPLLIVLGIAFLTPILITRIKRVFIPVIIGEVVAGIIIGQSGLQIVHENELLRILSELGFIYLMFLSGLEINFSGLFSSQSTAGDSPIKRWFSNYFFLGFVLFLSTLLLSFPLAYVLKIYFPFKDFWIMGLILSTTSLGVVMPVLKEKGMSGTRFGQSIMVSALVADFSSIFLISVYVLLHQQGLSKEVLLILVLLAAFAAVYRIAIIFQRHLPARRLFDELSSATSQLRLRGSLTLALLFVVLAETLGTENILGAFLAGVIVSMLSGEESSILRQKLDAIGYGFFIPIFFIMVGVNFDLPVLLNSEGALLLFPVLLAIAFLVKILPALVYRLHFSWRETFAAGSILSSRLSLIIAASTIGFQLGLISEEINSSIILIAVVTCTISPVIFSVVSPGKVIQKNRVIVVGCRYLSEILMKRLVAQGFEPVLLCTDSDQQRGQILGNLPDHKVRRQMSGELKKAGIEKAKMVVAMSERDEDNLMISRLARMIYGVDIIFAWVHDPTNNSKFRQLGVRIINPAYSSLLIIEGMIMNPDAFSMTMDVDENLELREIKLKQNNVVGKRVDDVKLAGDTRIFLIQRKDDIFVPDNGTILKANDTITLIGEGEEVEKSMSLFQP